jgi:cytoskeletal protein CcmA (bactofilin family)
VPVVEGDRVDPLPGVYSSLKARVWESREGVKILGDAQAEEARLWGTTAVRGSLTVGTLEVHGSLDVVGTLVARGRVRVSGDLRVGGACAAEQLDLNGSLRVGGALRVAGAVAGRGRISVEADTQLGELRFAGGVSSPGRLRAERLELKVDHDSRLGGIDGGRVVVTQGGSPFARKPTLVVLQVEAAEASMDAVQCEYLRARRIALGATARVARHDGEVVRRHRGARTGPESVSAPPPGLSR